MDTEDLPELLDSFGEVSICNDANDSDSLKIGTADIERYEKKDIHEESELYFDQPGKVTKLALNNYQKVRGAEAIWRLGGGDQYEFVGQRYITPGINKWSRTGLFTLFEEADCEKENCEEVDEEKENNGVEDDNNENNTNSKKRKSSTKVVVRRLPPLMNKQEFVDAVSPLPAYDYLVFDVPDPEWGVNARSVAHINFLDEEDALWFIERFNRYRFIDEEGEEYFAICDFAMLPRVLKNGASAKNPKRGTLKDSQHFQDFLKLCEETPLTYSGVLPNEGEILTTEMMLEEIENKPNKKELVTTPLLDFIMNKKISRRDGEKRLRRERVRSEKPLKREIERETSDRTHRELKKERKRERREQERKDRRERDKFEKEAKSKGMTVTYSKTGKVTRWSANSSPFAKKDVKDKSDEIVEDTEGSTEKLQQPSTAPTEGDSKSRSSLSNPKDKYTKSPKKVIHEPFKKSDETKRKPFNPFSKDSKKTENSFEEKCPFGKPFPSKKDSTTTTNSKTAETSKVKITSSSETASSSTPPFPQNSSELKEKSKESNEEDVKVPKKKIIKRIIRVKKVRDKNDDPPTTSTDSKIDSSSIPKKVNSVGSSSSGSSKLKSESIKSKENDRPKPKETFKSVETKKSSEDQGGKSEPNVSTSKNTEEDGRRRKARPDMQIYRPGSLRSSASTSKSTNDNSKPKPKQPSVSSSAGSTTTDNVKDSTS